MSESSLTRREATSALLAASALAVCPNGANAAAAAVPTRPVDTTSGKVRGMRSGGLSRFFGIPYGTDTARHRFQPAHAPEPWAGIRNCNELGPKTPQGPITISGVMNRMSGQAKALPIIMKVAALTRGDVPQSEACLVLNVITPDASPRRKRPVMVWLHGGGFAMGSGWDAMIDGSQLAAHGDVVYVSLNHRLNALGFLYLGGLHADFADSGNAGMLDIVLALEWVRDNIAQFGGDPHNVTIFGQSGGGAKVSTLLGMPPARGLFHKAIAMSGPVVKAVERTDAMAIAEQTLAKLGVAKSDVHTLQTMDHRKVIDAASSVRLPPGDGGIVSRTLAPMADGRSLPVHPFHPAATDISRNIPLMIGTARDECTMFMAGDPELGAMSAEHALARFKEAMGDARGEASFKAYRAAYPDDDPSYLVSSMMTDRMFRSDSIVMADRKSAQNAAPVFLYRVDYRPRVADGILRSPHGTEVPLVFGTKVPVEFMGAGPEVDALSGTMMNAWLRFARSGNPDGKDLTWPRFDATRRPTMLFDVQCRVANDPDPVSRDPVARGLA
ncbi:MAG: carboxylesterase/lipase family protein [Novosphingobium sp.]